MIGYRIVTTVGIIVLLGLVQTAPAPALARTRAEPALFALSPSVFPAGSTLVRSGVETNPRLRLDDPTHFGLPPAATGRINGYYMDAHDAGPTGQSAGYTSYLVSIFGSIRQAAAAYTYRWDTWFDANYYTSPGPSGIAVGDTNASALFIALAPQANHLTELFFRRKSVLVEVFQTASAPSDDPGRRQALYRIATLLDALAVAHPRGLS